MKILILSLAFLALGESFTPPRAVKSSYTFHANFMTGNEFQNTDSESTKNGAYEEVIDEEWESWKLEHNKVYKNEHEEKFRLKIFMENKHQIAQHNILYHQQKRNYSLTMNQFGDLLQHEFSGLMNGYRQDLKQQYGFTGAKHIPAANVQLPASIDWRKKGAVAPVKNQGHCGSCWAFSATGALEGQHFRQTGKLVSLSEQNLVDCSYVPESEIGNHGCEGGIMDLAFDFINTPEHGIDTEKSYPYIGRDPVDKSRPTICHFKKADIGATDAGHVDIESENENALKNALATIGPISVAIDASNLQFYDCSKNEGVFDGHCSSNQLNHGVLAVGYGTTKGGKDYWLIKNSWSEKWGCDGYFKLARNKNNKCGVATMASYPQV